MSQTRLNYINSLLGRLGSLRFLSIPNASDQIFELYCYFRKVEEFINRGKQPQSKVITHGIFSAHAKPGNPRSSSYFTLIDPSGDARDLILNGQFEGVSEIYHSPDLALTKCDSDEIVSIYECKNHSSPLGLGVYREFIGDCEEMGLVQKANKSRIKDLIDSYPELRPCIYTSAAANSVHKEKMKTYGFTVVDCF